MAQRIAPQIEVETLARSRQWLEAALTLIARYREASIAAVAVLLVAYIQINNSVFLSSPLMSVVLRDTARIGLISAGIVLVMITGEIDLSVGATFAMAPYLMIRMSTDWGWSLWLSAPVAILLGVGVGFFNGFITVKLRIPALITTLGTFFLLTGFTVSFAPSPSRCRCNSPSTWSSARIDLARSIRSSRGTVSPASHRSSGHWQSY